MLNVERPTRGPLARDVDCNGEGVGDGFANAAVVEREGKERFRSESNPSHAREGP